MRGLFVRLAAGVALGLALAPQAAQAQLFGYWGYQSFRSAIYPEDIADIVADEGMRLAGRPRLNGRVYVVQARDRRGAEFRLIISAQTGEILKSFEVAARSDAEDQPQPILPSPPLPQPQRRAARPDVEAEPPRIVPSAPLPQRRAARTPDPLVIPGIGREPAAPETVRKPAPRPKLVRRPVPVVSRPLPPPAVAAPPSIAAPAQAAPAHAAPPQQAVAPLGDGPVKKPPPADVPVAPLD